MLMTEHDVLAAAAEAARTAPSIFNPRPWQWRVDGTILTLRVDPDRQPTMTDPDARRMVLSCGASLHHARVALAAGGWAVAVERLPASPEPGLVARIHLVRPVVSTAENRKLYSAITRHSTDRQPFSDDPVAGDEVRRLVYAAEREGVRLRVVRPDQMPMLALAVALAEATEMDGSAYDNELTHWDDHPQWSNDEVRGVMATPHRAPVRDFVSPPDEGIPVGAGADRGSRYLIVYGDTDETIDWLRAGEGASAVMLTAVSRGLAVAPISDVTGIAYPRDLVRGLVEDEGQPYLVIRCGHPGDARPVLAVPGRGPVEAIHGCRP